MTDKTKEKIIELCPDVKGTHVFEVGYNKCKFCGEPRILVDRRSTQIRADKDSGGSINEVTTTEYNQIDFPCSLNPKKPSTLAVVLRAIMKMQPANKTLVNLECDGQFVEHWFNFSAMQSQLGPTWNLEHDNYDNQSEECKRFIGTLLGVE